MKKRLWMILLITLMAISSVFALVACNDEPDPQPGPTEYTAPVITVTPAEMELTQGTSEEEYSLLFGVTVTDEYDSNLKATVKNDGGFDIDTIGDYTVTYSATNSKGKEGTATRVYHIVAPLPNLVLRAQQENDATHWVDQLGHTAGLMTFANEEYVELTANKTYEVSTKGVFFNKSNGPIILSIPGSHGESVVLNSAGVVIEARDGANGKLVNKQNPVRTNSTVTSLPTEWFAEPEEGETPNYTVASNYAFHLEIPAGGFAIVIPNSGSFDEDGRGWLEKNVVRNYGGAVQLYFEDEPEELLTVYADFEPVVRSAENIIVHEGDSITDDQIEALLLQGIVYVDDNGTWDIADDVTSGLEITIASRPQPGFSSAEAGKTFTYKLKITDGTNEVEFERNVVVIDATPTVATISLMGTWYEFDEENIVVNPTDTSGLGSKSAIIYTAYFEGDYFVNNYGFYMIVDAEGKIREVLTPYNGGKLSKYDTDGTTVVEETVSTADVLQNVTLKAGEYVVLAVNGGAKTNSGATGVDLRQKLGDTAYGASATHLVGESVELLLIDWMPAIIVTPENGTERSFSGNKVYINAGDLTTKEFYTAAFHIYTPDFDGTLVNGTNANASGVAVVLNTATGKIVRIYDGANGRLHDAEHYWDTDNNSLPMADAGFTVNDYHDVAIKSLQEGEICLVFPNDGANAADSPRSFALGLRQRFLQYTFTFKNIMMEGLPMASTKDLQVKIGSATLTVEEVAVNVSGAVTANYDLLIFTYGFAGTYTNGYGYASVVKDGKIVRVYDGANGKYRDADNLDGVTDNTKCTAGGYAAEAIASLQEGEYVIIFPNGGRTADVRTWGNANARTINAEVELVNIDLTAQIKINGTALKVEKLAINVDNAVTANYDLLIFTYGFTGTYTNGYGYASVVKDGKIVRVYDGANGKYRDADNLDGVTDNTKCTAGGYAAEAIASLQEGEYVIIFPNGGRTADVRTWGNANARTINATVELVNIGF